MNNEKMIRINDFLIQSFQNFLLVNILAVTAPVGPELVPEPDVVVAVGVVVAPELQFCFIQSITSCLLNGLTGALSRSLGCILRYGNKISVGIARGWVVVSVGLGPWTAFPNIEVWC